MATCRDTQHTREDCADAVHGANRITWLMTHNAAQNNTVQIKQLTNRLSSCCSLQYAVGSHAGSSELKSPVRHFRKNPQHDGRFLAPVGVQVKLGEPSELRRGRNKLLAATAS